MAEAFEMTKDGKAGLEEAFEVYPDLPWMTDKYGQAHVFDEKKDEYVAVNKGDFIVHIGERYEVSDKKPSKAKEPEVKETDGDKSDDDDGVPEARPAEPPKDPEPGEAEVASTPNGAPSFE